MKTVRHRSAHGVHPVDQPVPAVVLDTMVVDSVDAIVSALAVCPRADDVHLVTASLQTGGEFRDMHPEPPGRDRMQRFG